LSQWYDKSNKCTHAQWLNHHYPSTSTMSTCTMAPAHGTIGQPNGRNRQDQWTATMNGKWQEDNDVDMDGEMMRPPNEQTERRWTWGWDRHTRLRNCPKQCISTCHFGLRWVCFMFLCSFLVFLHSTNLYFHYLHGGADGWWHQGWDENHKWHGQWRDRIRDKKAASGSNEQCHRPHRWWGWWGWEHWGCNYDGQRVMRTPGTMGMRGSLRDLGKQHCCCKQLLVGQALPHIFHKKDFCFY
jgi:hypothetical protein